MPDNRTVYSTDDGSNGVLVMFKADRPKDLSSGEREGSSLFAPSSLLCYFVSPIAMLHHQPAKRLQPRSS